MQIFVRGADELLTLDLEKTDTVHDIRVRFSAQRRVEYESASVSLQEYVAEEYDMDMEEIVLNFNGTPLSDEQTVEQFGLVSGSTLDATVKLFGGKVHGSLARAGKVKGQTPKVE